MTTGRLHPLLSSPASATLLACGVLWTVVMFGGCQSNEPVSYETPPQSAALPGTLSTYPDPMRIGNAGGAAFPETPGGTPGSVEALPPTPISLNGSAATTSPASPPTGLPKVTAKAAILVDGFGRVLFERNADAHLPAASTQKPRLRHRAAERGGDATPVTTASLDN